MNSILLKPRATGKTMAFYLSLAEFAKLGENNFVITDNPERIVKGIKRLANIDVVCNPVYYTTPLRAIFGDHGSILGWEGGEKKISGYTVKIKKNQNDDKNC